MRNFRALYAFVAISAAALSFGQAASPSTTELTAESKAAVLKEMEKVLTTTAYVPGVDFSLWPTMVEKKKAAIDAAASAGQFTAVVNSALQEFGFSHIVLYSPVMAQARTNRKMVGLGIRIQPEAEGIRVVWVFPDGPASQAGIEAGDLIYEADGKPVRQAGELGGEEGSVVIVKVKRATEEKSFTITRKPFSTDIPESVKWLDSETAVVVVPTFDLGYNKSKNLDNVMKEALKAKKLILDLRNNGGGSVVNLLHLSSYFLGKDEPLGTFVGRTLVRRYEEKTGDKSADVLKVAAWEEASRLRANSRAERFQGQVAVLVNEGTGSASEMMAAALREYRGAKIVGQKSAGAVLASYMWPIKDGFTLQFPVTDYVTIKGLRIEGTGIKPDIEAPTNARYGEEDKALLAAAKSFAG